MCIRDSYRSKKRIPKYESCNSEFDIFYKISETSKNIEESMIDSQIKNDLNDLIEELPQNQYEVLKMRLYQDMSFKEISERTNVSINTSLGRMRYGLINLRKIIKERNLSMIQ